MPPQTSFTVVGRTLWRARARLEDERIVLTGWAGLRRFRRVIVLNDVVEVSIRKVSGGSKVTLGLDPEADYWDHTIGLILARGGKLWYHAIRSRSSAEGTDYNAYDDPYRSEG